MRVINPARGARLWLLQMKAMLMKRFIYAIRNWSVHTATIATKCRRVTVAQVLVPAWFVLFAMIINTYLLPPAIAQPPLPLDLNGWVDARVIMRWPQNDTQLAAAPQFAHA